MLKHDAALPEEQHFILSTLSPGAVQKGLALAVVAGISAVFLLITFGPFKGLHLHRVDAFVPMYAAAMFVCDSITAILLYAQFAIVRSRATVVIASGYLFAAINLIPWILVFPGVFTPGRGLMGGMQTTSWVYFFQHAGFPLFVIGYALMKDRNRDRFLRQGSVVPEIALSIALTAAVVLAGAFFFIAGHAMLPRVTLDSTHLSKLWPYAAAPVALLNIAAIVVLWTRRRVALDLWLMIVSFLWAIEIPLSYYPDPERFSLGWYTVRFFGLFASSIVLILLITEIATLYARLLGAVVARHREREARLMTGDAVAASIAHEVRQPLTAMITTADAGLRFIERDTPNIDKAKEAFSRIIADGHRAGDVVGSIRATFKSEVPDKTAIDVNDLIEETVALAHADVQAHGIVVQVDANERLPDVTGNRVQLQQVLLNLIVNAIESMTGRDEPRILSIKSEGHENDRVMVSVADTGAGIGPQDADRIFNPLFTTKTNGMGMGLSICRAIVEAHEGRLAFSSNSPRGTVFRLTLPGR